MSAEAVACGDQVPPTAAAATDGTQAAEPVSSSLGTAEQQPAALASSKVFGKADAPQHEVAVPVALGAKRRLFVSNLQPTITEAQLFDTFKQFGTVTEVTLFRDNDNQTGAGHAFVVYTTAEAALEAMAAMDEGSALAAEGAALVVEWAVGQSNTLCLEGQQEQREQRARTLFFAKVPPTASAADITQLFQQHGEVLELNLFRAWAGAKNSKGCGLVVMGSRQAAAAALEALNLTYTWPDMESPMVVEWMHQAKQRSAGSGREPKAKESCKVVLGNLPAGLLKEELLHTLAPLGEIVEVHITGEAPGQVYDGTGFVRFATKELATAAVASLQARPVHFVHPGTKAKHVMLATKSSSSKTKGAQPAEGGTSSSGPSSSLTSSSRGGLIMGGGIPNSNSSGSGYSNLPGGPRRGQALMRTQPGFVPDMGHGMLMGPAAVRPSTPVHYTWPIQQAHGGRAELQYAQPPYGPAHRHMPVWHTVAGPDQSMSVVPPGVGMAGPGLAWTPVDVCEALVAVESGMGHMDVPVHVQHVLAQQVCASLPEVPMYGGPSSLGCSQGPPGLQQMQGGPSPQDGYGPGVPRHVLVAPGNGLNIVPVPSWPQQGGGRANLPPQQQQQGMQMVQGGGAVLGYGGDGNQGGYQLPGVGGPQAYQMVNQVADLQGLPRMPYHNMMQLQHQQQQQHAPQHQQAAARQGYGGLPPSMMHSGGGLGSRYLPTSAAASSGLAAGPDSGPGNMGSMLQGYGGPRSQGGNAGAATQQLPVGGGSGSNPVWGPPAAAVVGPDAATDTVFVPLSSEQAYLVADQLVAMAATTDTRMLLVSGANGAMQVAIIGSSEQRQAAQVLLHMLLQDSQGMRAGVGTL